MRRLLIDGNHGRDGLGRIVRGGCGYGHRIAWRNHRRSLVLGRNIAGDWVRRKRATRANGNAGELHSGIHRAVGDDRCNTRCRAAGQRSGRRKIRAKRNHNCRSLVLGSAAGRQYGEHGCRHHGQQEIGLAKAHGTVRFNVRFMTQNGILALKIHSRMSPRHGAASLPVGIRQKRMHFHRAKLLYS